MSVRPLHRVLTLVVGGVLFSSIYGISGTWTAHNAQSRTLESVVDRMVPFQAAWVLVYALVFFQALAPLSVVTEVRALQRTVLGYAMLYMAALPIWILFPVEVPREPIPITDLWTYGVALTRYVDPPTNCLPSMHVGLALYAALVVRRHDRPSGDLLLFSAALISYSTLSIHQHWAADVAVAAIIALVADALAFGLRPLPAEALRPLPRRWHALWVTAYVASCLGLCSGYWFGFAPLEVLERPPW